MGEILPPGESLTQRDLFIFMTKMEMTLEKVTGELKQIHVSMESTLSEMTDRVDMSADGIRKDFTEKIRHLEKDVEEQKKDSEDQKKDIKSLNESRTYQKAWIAGAMFVAAGIGWLISHFFGK